MKPARSRSTDHGQAALRTLQRLVAAGVVACACIVGCKPREASNAPSAQPTARTSETTHPAGTLPRWAVSPTRPGNDRPPVGQSLFDAVTTRPEGGRRVRDVPFPFEALLARIDERAGCSAQASCVQAVLIPLGRSLQRMTASPDFFAHPRVVAAVVAEAGPGADTATLLKDRLYIGYQDRSARLEVISYNPAAGRFEFQRVDDYRAGGTPRVRYARRDVCTSCHQNLAPVFPRPLWAETNADPRIAARLQRTSPAFFGVAVQRGVDIPAAIDAATDRANLFPVWQLLWRDACGANDLAGRRCRGAAVLAALQLRLAGGRGFDQSAPAWREHVLPTIARQWRRRWSAGLAIPNPDLTNRDPLSDANAPRAGAMAAHVPARFEPLQPRLPLEIWHPPADGATADTQAQALARRFISGLGDFFSGAELRALDRQLRLLAEGAGERRVYRGDCTLQREPMQLRFQCEPPQAPDGVRVAGRLELHGDRVGGEVESLVVGDGAPMHYLAIESGSIAGDRALLTVHEEGRRVRLTGGASVESIELRWQAAAGSASKQMPAHVIVSVADDLAPVRDTLAAWSLDLAVAPLSMQPFDASRLMAMLLARIGGPALPGCCDTNEAWPATVVEPAPPAVPRQGPTRPFAAFYTACASCHATDEPTPPNFLDGSPAQVVAKLRQCAPRIYVRLAMWRRDATQRDKMPMPPPIARPYAYTPQAPAQVAALERIAADLLRAETGRQPQVDALLGEGYESLRPCLPVAGRDREAPR